MCFPQTVSERRETSGRREAFFAKSGKHKKVAKTFKCLRPINFFHLRWKKIHQNFFLRYKISNFFSYGKKIVKFFTLGKKYQKIFASSKKFLNGFRGKSVNFFESHKKIWRVSRETRTCPLASPFLSENFPIEKFWTFEKNSCREKNFQKKILRKNSRQEKNSREKILARKKIPEKNSRSAKNSRKNPEISPKPGIIKKVRILGRRILK